MTRYFNLGRLISSSTSGLRLTSITLVGVEGLVVNGMDRLSASTSYKVSCYHQPTDFSPHSSASMLVLKWDWTRITRGKGKRRRLITCISGV
jgi:hypothetical protein